MCGNGFRVPAEGVSRVVALLQGDSRVGVLVRHHREDQHREREDEIAQLRFQGAVLSLERAEGYITARSKSKRRPA